MNNNFFVGIKKLSLLCMLLPLMATSQVKNVVTTQRVFPKIDKVLEFEKALTNIANWKALKKQVLSENEKIVLKHIFDHY